ncbi:hypothetical protein JCM12298_11910 [Desulfothermus naphthae]
MENTANIKKKLELRPQLNSQIVSLLFKHSPIGIYIISKRRFKYVNPQFEKITGYTFKELKKIRPNELICEQDRERVRESAISMLKGKRDRPFVNKIKNKNGQIKYILESVCSILFNGEESVLGFFLDNTEEELIKEELKRSEEKFEKAFQLSPDWIVISTLVEGIYLEVNAAFLDTTGYSREEVIGKSSIELGIWADPKQRDELHEILKKYGKICNAEVQFRKKDDSIIDVLWSAHKIKYDNKDCLIAVARDVTELKKAAQERLMREKLQGVLEMAGATCHEMNQPLQNILLIIEEILDDNPTNKNCLALKKQVERIKEITYKLENITRYSTKEYVKGIKIIDIDKSSSYCRINGK